MSYALTITVTVSLIGLLACLGYLELRPKPSKRLLANAILIALVLIIVFLIMPNSVETKGPAEETISMVFCYVAMVLGMMAEYGYTQAKRGVPRLKFEPLQFLMPIFASPIVFIPLLTITAEVSVGGAFAKPKLMVYLVAFQNGFFWKSFVEQQRQNVLEAVSSSNVEIPRGDGGQSAEVVKHKALAAK